MRGENYRPDILLGLLAFLVSFLSVVPFLSAAEVRKASFQQVGNRVEITYDLEGGGSPEEVLLTVTVQGKEYLGTNLHIEGDVGNVRPGSGRKITWHVLRDFPKGIEGELVWDLSIMGARDPASASDTPREWKSPDDMYEYAVALVKDGNPKKGREILVSFLGKYPDHKLVPNAFYWKGEAFFEEKMYEDAILTFQDLMDKYPGEEKAPDAMYKQGLSFLSLKDRKNARILLDLVTKKYPRSKAAEMAKKKLQEIR